MTKSVAVTLAIAVFLTASPSAGAQRSHPPGEPAGLEAFDSCDSLLQYARGNALERLEPAAYGPVGKPRPAPQSLQMQGGAPGRVESGPESFSGTTSRRRAWTNRSS